MTFGRTNIQFVYLYPLFKTYWNFVTRYHNRSLPIEQYIILSWRVYEKIKKEWIEMKWDIAELDWICTALDRTSSMLDPYNFVDQPIAFVIHAKKLFSFRDLFKK